MKCACCDSKKIGPVSHGPATLLACRSCGFHFRIQAPEQHLRQELVSHYQEVDPHQGVADSKHGFFGRALRHLAATIDRKKPARLLDVGCGHGYFLEMAEKQGFVAHGIELAQEAAEGARTRVGQERVEHGSLESTTFAENFFDAITLWDCLVFFDKPGKDLSTCHGLLAPGGIIGIRVRNVLFQKSLYVLYEIAKKLHPNLKMKKPYVFHPNCFNANSLRHLLSRAGFVNIRIVNSPLTALDPYGYTRVKGVVGVAKISIYLFSQLLYAVSFGKLVVGPSLLVWAEKGKR